MADPIDGTSRMDTPPELLTDRLRLRDTRAGDFLACAALWGDPVDGLLAGAATRILFRWRPGARAA